MEHPDPVASKRAELAWWEDKEAEARQHVLRARGELAALGQAARVEVNPALAAAAANLLGLDPASFCFRSGQYETLQAVLTGRDVLGVCATGSGKTLCFLLPIALMLAAVGRNLDEKTPRVEVVCPLRELMLQHAEEADRLFGAGSAICTPAGKAKAADDDDEERRRGRVF